MSQSQKPFNRALSKIRAGEVLNVFVMGNMASPRLVDFVCRSGYFDVIWFDLEHFDISTQDLAILNMVARAYPVSTIARIKADNYQVVMRTLETGVDGIMCAMVADEHEAAQIVRWAKFNNPSPVAGEITGNRGWNAGNIDAGYGNMAPIDYMKFQNMETMILCQIEHEEALLRAQNIADVPGVDGLFFGPGDYSTSLGLAGQISHESVLSAMEKVASAARKGEKWWGTVSPGVELYNKAKSLGGQFLCPGGDVKLMNLGLRELWKSFQEIPSAATTETEVPEPARY